MSKATNYEDLFERYGDHQVSMANSYLRQCWMPTCPYQHRNTGRLLRNTRRKSIGRAYRVYAKIRELNGY